MDANNNVMAITESNTVTNCMLHFVWQLSSTHELYSEIQFIENHQIASIFCMFHCVCLNVQGKYISSTKYLHIYQT